ncbi:PLP-dependent aminotransferase family protein [Bacillus sp. FJAT-49736]|uniref:MocR-like pyridoxine biosynthesis transcription factor PdxR n=1 Tax=Bacillus sp. FJAT-49736 TaxID=2833582 RepID=UPI001BC946AA|nr:PLP-dependent aminotransferase family protein [Bacillus sp. FJAT-49736]MBS4175236.1 PLP-dependent aminotransferase family protein [Bacillus sp. FJAT-49736]
MFISLDTYINKYKYKYLALYHYFRDLILDGQLQKGSRLPSTREVAIDYGLNRNTVSLAYDMLLSEGYTEAIKGSGTFVSFSFVDQSVKEESNEREVRLSDWGKMLPRQGENVRSNQKKIIDFGSGFDPDLENFPSLDWKKAVNHSIKESDYLLSLKTLPVEGIGPLRESISSYLLRAKGLKASADDIIILNGSMHGISILLHLLVKPGDKVVIEDPGFKRIKDVIHTTGGIPLPVSVLDESFMNASWDSHLAYVTPSYQYPTGKIMPMEQRIKLLQWASEKGAIIIEDDYDSDFRRKGRAIEPLKVLDTGQRVVYLGTFTKTIMPSLRIGFAVVPPYLKHVFLEAKHLFEPYTTSVLEQLAISSFIKSGAYERHIRRMNRIYTQKYHVFKRLMEEHLRDLFTWEESQAGFHLFAWWKRSAEEYLLFVQNCQEEGLYWPTIQRGFVNEPARKAVIFGYSHLSTEQMENAIQIMAKHGRQGLK